MSLAGSERQADTPRTKDNKPKTSTVNLRVDPGLLGLIDRAAASLGSTRTAFMLETAVDRAESILLDKRLFLLDDATYEAFVARLDEPAVVRPRLRALLRRKAPWAK